MTTLSTASKTQTKVPSTVYYVTLSTSQKILTATSNTTHEVSGETLPPTSPSTRSTATPHVPASWGARVPKPEIGF